MTAKDMIFEAKVMLKRGVVSVTLDEMTLRILLNSALQWVYPLAMEWDRSFYLRSHAFLASTSVAKSGISGFNKLIACITPTATYGAARISHFTEAEELENNTYLAGSTDSPHVWEEQTTIEVRPSIAGTFYYLFKFGEVPSLTYNVSATGDPANPAYIPWVWEKPVILKMLVMARERHLLEPEVAPGDMAKRMKALQDANDALNRAMQPLNRTAVATASPAYPIPEGAPSR